MITGEIRNQIDRIWDAFWAGGISNPLEVIEQITYLLFLKGRAIEYLLEAPHMDIGAFEALCPDVSRRTLQRDLGALEAKGLVWHEGETNQLVYRLATSPSLFRDDRDSSLRSE